MVDEDRYVERHIDSRSGWARDIAVAGDIAELKAALPSLKGAVDQTNAMLREHVSEQRMENSQLKTDVSARFDKLEAKQLVVDARVSALELLHAKEDAVRAKDSVRAGWAHKIFGGAITGGIMAAGAAIWSFIQQARHPVAAIAVSATLLCATGADAATYYVACGTGSNSAAGSSAAPWATITYAASRVAAGDTVVVKPGTCVESVRTQASGQPASPITYRAETRGAAKIVPPANNTSEAAWEQGGSNVVVDGFEIDGSAHQSGTRWKRGIAVLGQQVTVTGNVVHGIGRLAACADAGYGIGAPEEAGYVTIHANTVHAIGNPTCGSTPPPPPPDPVETDGILQAAIPFVQPERTILQASTKKVIAHWHQFPISRSKGGPDGDWYDTQFPKVRLRPLPRPARTSAGDLEWRIEDALADIRQARASGVDAFLVNVYRTDMTNPWAWPVINYMLKAAARDNKGFKVAPNFDCSWGGDAAQGTAMANQYADYIASIGEVSSPNLARVGSSYLAGTYWAQNCQAAHWTAFKTRMAQRGMPTHLMCVFTGGGYRAEYDSACDSWSDWGERSADQALNLNWRTRYSGVQGGEPIAGVISHGDTRYNENASGHDWSTSEQRGFGTLRNTWGEVLNDGADWAHLVTWNDIGEHSQMYPNTAGQWAFYDLNAYYIAWFKTGAAPEINKDAIYYSHRIAQVPSGSSMVLRHQPWADTIDVMAFLTAPATVEITTSAGTTSQAFDAGLRTLTAPMPASGKPRIKIIRDGSTVVDVESQWSVGAMPATHDVVYRAGGSLRTGIGTTTPAATVCTSGTPDECLQTPGEPVWRKE